jgi:RNA polymerase sigma-70 factor, ECF subfamily
MYIEMNTISSFRGSDWDTARVLRAQQGDIDAFESLVDDYRGNLMATAMRSLRNADDANDAVQETLVKAFRAIRTFKAGRPFGPWISRICSNCCVDQLRHRRGQSESLDKHEYGLAADVDLEHDAERSEEDQVVRAVVSRLPDHYRAIVMMRHFEHMDVCEIAERVSKPEGTIKSWLFRARALMKKDLQKQLAAA